MFILKIQRAFLFQTSFALTASLGCGDEQEEPNISIAPECAEKPPGDPTCDIVEETNFQVRTQEDLDLICSTPCSRVTFLKVVDKKFTSEQLAPLKRITTATTVSVENINAEDLSFLSGLREVGDISVQAMPKLKSLEGLERLETVRRISIENNSKLRDLRGLEGLKEVGLGPLDNIFIYQNHNLRSLHGLDNLERARGVHVQGNSKLKSFDGLRSLKELYGPLVIESNESLTSLSGMSSLRQIFVLNIENNKRLPTCEAEAILTQVGGREALQSEEGPRIWDTVPSDSCD